MASPSNLELGEAEKNEEVKYMLIHDWSCHR